MVQDLAYSQRHLEVLLTKGSCIHPQSREKARVSFTFKSSWAKDTGLLKVVDLIILWKLTIYR